MNKLFESITRFSLFALFYKKSYPVSEDKRSVGIWQDHPIETANPKTRPSTSPSLGKVKITKRRLDNYQSMYKT
jgi:hypothetical protein